jgi:hypothetical protein
MIMMRRETFDFDVDETSDFSLCKKKDSHVSCNRFCICNSYFMDVDFMREKNINLTNMRKRYSKYIDRLCTIHIKQWLIKFTREELKLLLHLRGVKVSDWSSYAFTSNDMISIILLLLLV